MTSPTDAGAGAPVGCSLGGSEQSTRIAEWHALLRQGTPVAAAEGRAVDLPRHLAHAAFELVLAEQDCCPFFRFTLTLSADGLRLTATTPPSATVLLDEVFGASGEQPVSTAVSTLDCWRGVDAPARSTREGLDQLAT
ncbi:hypothetical protein SAMN05661080_03781 [Modestobacter sp. DSM 44400]|uniref:hypothetical protein n=1 Tax=Modestobacter sp. DSM 44400 TaxID=1550230 RepID=UPI00089A2A29|nr:hypothetical protein [Modestobacter sp. DSM 44400]SDY53820.1 hypothetical protein SAMN05661080_03781 [Modestobacter sp. DSM 44400]